MNSHIMPMMAAIGDVEPVVFLAPIAGLAALIMAKVFASSVMKRSEGDAEMIRIAQAVREGAMAYLKRQYKVVSGVFVLLIAVLFLLSFGLGLQPKISILGVPIAGFLSGLCGWFGMRMATNASARTAAAAKDNLNDGLTVAFRSGAVMGMNVVGFALLDVSIWYIVLNAMDFADIRVLTTVMLSFGMGASTQALFARVGGGIYTKAADVGADLVGKVEAGIPEDDARNPATIADNVGDNVGDVAGMGADLYESYYGSILATLALGAAAAFTIKGIGEGAAALAMKLTAAPLVLAGLGIFCSILGVFTVKAKEGASFKQLLAGLHFGVYAASSLIVLASLGLLYVLFGQTTDVSWLGLWGSICTGLASGLVIAYATEHYTSYEHGPTKRIALQALTGPATVIISGIAEGMKSTWAALLTVVIAIILAFTFAGGNENFLMGLYGVGIAAVGMLSTLGITLATDAYGPIADNAGGNAEMTGQPPHVRERTDMLDSLGNTTAATGKGFAIGSAALTALALFAAYIQVVQTQLDDQAGQYIQANAAVVYADGAPSGPHAVYKGHNRFAIVLDSQDMESVEGGLLLDSRTMGEMNGKLPVGSILNIDSVGNTESNKHLAHVYQLGFNHGGTSHDLQFDLVRTSKATIHDVLLYYDVTMLNPRVLGGLFMGVLLAFLFCALTMNAVGRAANEMMTECRRQFGKMREAFRANGMSEEDIANPESWPKQVEHENISYPDYATCVSISTAGAQREMIFPAILAITVPIIVGLVLDVPGVVGLLAGGLTSGFAVAIFMANAGGAWDNAKKLLESYGRITATQFINDAKIRDKVPAEIHKAIHARAEEFVKSGHPDAYVYGKGSDDHKATVVGDTVGDPFKDTSGPSLNILIKLISIVSVVFAGLTVKYGAAIGALIGLN